MRIPRPVGCRGQHTSVRIIASTVALALLLSACAAGANPEAGVGPHRAGFWQGLWHGLTSPITFLLSLFRNDVEIYEVHNNGGWYDFGFMLGVPAVFSGVGRSGASAAGQSRRKRSIKTAGTDVDEAS